MKLIIYNLYHYFNKMYLAEMSDLTQISDIAPALYVRRHKTKFPSIV